MTVGSLVGNFALIGLLVGVTGVITDRFRTCLYGALPALSAAFFLILVRALVYYLGRTDIFATLGLAWMAAVVVVEEAAKFTGANAYTFNQFYSAGNTTERSHINRSAVAFGTGFAAVEHLLFIMQPFSLFLVRWIFASGLHIGTTWLYFTVRRSDAGHLQRIGLLLVGVLIHLCYNLVVMVAGHLTFS